MPTSPPLIGVIDVETTGLYPHYHDRIVEVAVVVMGIDGAVDREFVSLVNPDRDIGPSSIHGIVSADVLAAPYFSDLSGHLTGVLRGAVAIAGHNVRFDIDFLGAEFRRLNQDFPECPHLCTMRLTHGRSLRDCCNDLDIPFHGTAHCALDDARATAKLLHYLISDQAELIHALRNANPILWPDIPRTAVVPVTRAQARLRHADTKRTLQEVAEGVASATSTINVEEAIVNYLVLAERAIEDRRLDETEVSALSEWAAHRGLTKRLVEQAHLRHFATLCSRAAMRRPLSEYQRRDLTSIGSLLGLQEDVICTALKNTTTSAQELNRADATDLGVPSPLIDIRSVCFSGEFQCRVDGQQISRDLAKKWATDAGLMVRSSISRTLDLLVLADPYSQSSKAKQARAIGTRIWHESKFWNALEIEVD